MTEQRERITVIEEEEFFHTEGEPIGPGILQGRDGDRAVSLALKRIHRHLDVSDGVDDDWKTGLSDLLRRHWDVLTAVERACFEILMQEFGRLTRRQIVAVVRALLKGETIAEIEEFWKEGI